MWAAGSTWLLETVGDAAPATIAETGASVSLVLLLVGVLKIVAAVVPVLVVARRLPWPRAWRAACWLGGGVLLLYGAANAVVAWFVLAGVVVPDGGFDEAAMLGHAFLWDPLFAVWGALLLVALRRSRPRRSAPGAAR